MDPIRTYHERSKHHLHRYADGPGGLDWATQPDPFRRFDGAPVLDLPLLDGELPVTWDRLFGARRPPAAPFTRKNVAGLLELSLGLSAWKRYEGSRWALRCNPSSGNLHPTEAYLICSALPDLPAGVHHYRPDRHALEQRAAAPLAWDGGMFVALTGIHWREAWKYGLRAFRYCQHDCGHALAALGYAAAVFGWHTRLLTNRPDDAIAALVGLDRDGDFIGAEHEAPEALLWIGIDDPPAPTAVRAMLDTAVWHGHANTLSPSRRDWPDIPLVAAATRRNEAAPATPITPAPLPPLAPVSPAPASRLIRQRRSAQAFDGVTAVSAQRFFRMLDALLPRAGIPPWLLWHGEPSVHPVLFVHRIDGIEPGVYCLPRSPEALTSLRAAMREDWLWARVPGAPAHLPLYLLAPLDARSFAETVSCHQAIASDSAFSLAMLARFDDIGARYPARYRERFWEAGVLGQVLYLEAEAASVQGTGIGCYFDDAVHDALGLDTDRFQDLYHFTVGGALVDTRLGTESGYAFLGAAKRA